MSLEGALKEQLILAAFNTALSLAAGVVGFILAQVVDRQKSRREQAARNDGARRMIRVEIEQNLAALNAIARSTDTPEADEDVRREEQIASLPELRWSHRLWESQLPFVPDALIVDEIELVAAFHESLARLTTIRQRIAECEDDRDEAIARTEGNPWHAGAGNAQFLERAKPLAVEFHKTVKQLIADGNPIKDD